MFLSFGSAIPYAGWGVTALDFMREVDKAAYEKHIGGMVKGGDMIGAGEGFYPWFQDAFGGEASLDDLKSYESGTPYTKSGLAMGHGVELVTGADWNPMLAAMSPGASSILGASSTFMNHSPAAASLSSAFKHKQNNLESIFGHSRETATMPGSSGSVSSAATAIDKMSGLARFSNQGEIFEKFKRSLDGKPNKPDPNQPTAIKTWDGVTVDSDFKNILPQGNPTHTNSQTQGFRTNARPNHNGIDIGVDGGSPVLAAESGTVESIYPFGDVGQQVTIRHADGSANLYGHITPSVSEGQDVSRGDQIGAVKYWENDDGTDNTHLHFERFDKGTSKSQINPNSYLNDLNRNYNLFTSNTPEETPSHLQPETILASQGGTGVVTILMEEPSEVASVSLPPPPISMGGRRDDPFRAIQFQRIAMA
jgi:murein DD-endopeptidase MepM/ murein hydrolase activator NlpD